MAQDLTKALDRLAELLTAKTAEAVAAAKATDGASLSAASLPRQREQREAEGVQKLELTPNEVKLEG
jgi:hypothetical protein